MTPEEPAPPWIALPGLSPDDPCNQGAGEAYIVLEFVPFWTSLTAALDGRPGRRLTLEKKGERSCG